MEYFKFRKPYSWFLIILSSAFLLLFIQNISSQQYYPSNPVVIGGDSDYPPFEYINKGYIPKGFNVDIVRAIAKTMGLNIEIRLDKWSDIREAFESGEVDMLQGMYYSEERAKKYDFTSPHIVMYQAVFSRDNSPAYKGPESLKNKEIIVQRGDIMHEYAVENNLTDYLILADSPAGALRMLASGRHDFVLCSRITGLYWIKELGLKNLTSGDNLVSYKYCMAVPKDNPRLVGILNEGLSIIQQTGVYSEIYDKWFSILEPDVFFIKRFLKYIYIFTSALFLLLTGSVLWTWSLKSTVRKRTAELKKEISEHIRADMELKESQELYRILFSESTDAIVLINAETLDIIKYNKKAYENLLYSDKEFACLKLEDIFRFETGNEIVRHVERIKKRGFDRYEAIVLTKTGAVKNLLINSKIIHVNDRDLIQSIWIDITEKKMIEENIRQAGKLEAVGTLAGGIAHDFNNVLAAIIGYAEIAQLEIGEKKPGRYEVDEILKAGLRARDIVKQILLFSRKSDLNKESVYLPEILEDSGNFLRAAIPKSIRITEQKGEGIKKICANSTQIYQILLNLCTNASHAMEEKGGTITISIENMELDGTDYVRLSVGDTGPGIDENIRDKIFDPYFTTKGIGKGSGMGLAVVHGIVEENDGFISVDNRPGEGVIFHIYFPADDYEGTAKSEAAVPARGGSETIMVIDDEKAVVEIISRHLSSAGYFVISESDSFSALKTYTQKSDEIDLVITDQTMPELSGLSLAYRMREIKKVPFILATGYSSKVNFEDFSSDLIDKLMIKPVSKNKLLKTVRDLLDR